MLIALSIVLHVVASVFLKLGAVRLLRYNVISIILNPYYLTALAAMAGQAVTWMYALKNRDLGKTYLVTSVYFPILLLVSMLVFKEPITILNCAGMVLIAIGVSGLTKKGSVNAPK